MEFVQESDQKIKSSASFRIHEKKQKKRNEIAADIDCGVRFFKNFLVY